MKRQILDDLADIAHDIKTIRQLDVKIKEKEVEEATARTKKRQLYIKKMEFNESVSKKINALFSRESKAKRKNDNT